MTFWQENYPFVKEIYTDRHTKMADWMENVEKAIARILADKVYTSAEFKRERDIFYVSSNELSIELFFYIITVCCIVMKSLLLIDHHHLISQ